MYDKKRIALLLSVIAALGLIIALCGVWFVMTLPQESDSKPSATPTSSSATSAPGFTNDLRDRITAAAATAAQFQGSDTKAARERSYLKVGFTPALAASFEPVWFDVFNTATKTKIESTGETLIGAAVSVKGSVLITDVSATGQAGQRAYTVAVDVDCQPQWSTDAGGPFTASPFTATWRLTIDEATGQITDIEQPTADEIPFKPKA